MDRIPTLTKGDRIGFLLFHIIFIVPPFYYFFFILRKVPRYFSALFQAGPAQPLGWMFFILLCFDFLALGYLGVNSIRNIEKRTIKRSIIIMVLIILLTIFTFMVIFSLPAIYLLFNIIFSL